ncbi:MAG TPA: putative baseplate assembly protein [Streptosporangiaceae bacterium]|nr:putative baseplate assembly protein [Streptosporangiaceae bacterium]
MPLPVPNLDDRRFQDLVDDAKRLVQRRCPEWTDHNVSDPGVTLIETFAYMTDQLLYRLNRVPDRIYLKFLDLIGLRMLPPTPASVPVTFWLAAPASTALTIAAATRVGTLRTQAQESIEFATIGELVLPPRKLLLVRTTATPTGDDDEPRPDTADRTPLLAAGTPFPVFGDPPEAGHALLIGLDDPAPRCAIRIDFEGRVEGIGVNPERPPLVWEAWTGDGEWTACEVTLDETGGFNRSGSVIVHVPADHQVSITGGDRAGWLRARITEPDEGQPPYTSSPVLHALSACTVGGTTLAVHGEVVEREELGVSEGVPGLTLRLSRSPVLAATGDLVVEVSTDEGWQAWTQVDDFASSGPADRHFVLDAYPGLVIFGPAVREPGGSLRQYGAVPPAGAAIRIRRYATGGGRIGNVITGAVRTLKSSVPFVASVENLHPAQGGVDGETLEEAKARGPLLLRSRGRAVTAEDYEALTKQAAPEIARVRCVPAGEGASAAGAVRVLIVPSAASEGGRIRFENLLPAEKTLATIAEALEDVRIVGTRVSIEPPLYRGITVVARLIARPRVNAERLRSGALRALYGFLSPLPGGGPEGDGWPFGRPVQSGEIFGLLQRVQGVDMIEDVRIFSADPVTGKRGEEAHRINLEAGSLVFSYDHQIRVEEH